MNICNLAACYAPLSGRLLLALTIVLAVGGGLMILFGWYARRAAAVLFVWMSPVTVLYHDFWTVQPVQLFNQTTHFLKNLAIMGALLHLFGMGPGPLSLNEGRGGGTDGGVA
jgi:putative oxidoreductase